MSEAGPLARGLTVGQQLGPYRLEEAVGAGGIARVFKARGPDGGPIAIKVLHPSSLETDEERRFQREYRALARLRHPNIVQVHEAGVHDGYPWIAMEYVEGADLDATVEGWADLEPKERWRRSERILRGLCAALEAVHELGLVHRDLKPANVLVSADGVAKLSDFGVVKDRHGDTTALTRHGNLVGTVAFMAPEQITHEAVDPRTDLYSLGAVLYVMLTGRRPIEADSVTAFLARHLSHVPPPPSTVQPEVPRRLEVVCQRLLYKDPGQRYPSARAVLAALDDLRDPDALPLRGREALLRAARERLGTLGEGAAGLVVLEGPPLSGRTATLDALAGLAGEGGLRVGRASGPSPVTELLRDLGGPAATTPLARHLRALAAGVRGRPTLLLVDDLDRAPERMGDALVRLVEKLSEEGEAVLVVASGAEAAGGLAPVSEAAGARWRLGGLPRRALAQMLRDRGVRGATAGALASRMLRELGGLPGAVHAQVQALTEAGWLTSREGRLVPSRPPADLAAAPLPIPEGAQRTLEAELAGLDPELLTLLEALTMLDRAASRDELAHLLDGSPPVDAGRAFIAEDEQGVHLSRPFAAPVIRARMDRSARRAWHDRIAEHLIRTRRRAGAPDIGHHLEASGRPSEAYPWYVRAARLAARHQQHAEVLGWCARARAVRRPGEARLSPDQACTLRRRLFQYEGEAHLARGGWEAAREPLEQAVDAARELGDAVALTRALGALGRAWYRLGRFAEATPILEEALMVGTPDQPERAPAVRALADLRLRERRFDEARALWDEALRTARQAGSRDAEARARRGLAHLRALSGDLPGASQELDRALDLLRGGSAHRVRAGVLARAIELDLAGARFAGARHRAEELVELVTTRDLSDRAGEAWFLAGEVRARTHQGAAEEAADRATPLLRGPGGRNSLGLRLARLWLDLGRPDRAAELLPDQGAAMAPDPVEDPSGSTAALRARLEATRRPEQARDLARWCLVRPPATLVLSQAARLEDVGWALLDAGHASDARRAAKEGLALLQGPGLDGLRLRLLRLFHAADPDPRVAEALETLLRRVLARQPPALRADLASHPHLEPFLTRR